LLIDEIASAVRAVGAKVLQCRDEGKIDGTWHGPQFKAEADLIADECMRESLRRIENIPLISEEDVGSQREDRPFRYWLIDPIDGTASFAHGFAGFVCQAALVEGGQALLSAVVAPALNRIYTAELGKGSFLNGKRITAKPVLATQLTLVDNYPEPRGVAARLFRDLPCAHYVESGSIGLKICMVADGTADLFVKDVVVRDWDVAAPLLVIREAGGFLRQYSGAEFVFSGSYEKQGLIATTSQALIERIDSLRRQPQTSH
jgi:fructose-1,6-bisphosphatase/inositol monophosphatase family enzyme